MESPTLKKEHWRKSGQWFALNRRHVQIVVVDTEVAEAFKECARCPLCTHWSLQQCSPRTTFMQRHLSALLLASS